MGSGDEGEPYDPEEVERISGVPAADLRRAAEWIGKSKSMVTTCLQGVYQSNQATATACCVNTMHLLMGKIGKPGCAPFQFAGQPSSTNTRECGADGSYPAHRNWANPAHMAELAHRWRVPVQLLGTKPVSAPEIFEMCALGYVKVLWIVGTNPAVSMMDRGRQLEALSRPFVIVQDPFLMETCAFADVYLPTAMWGEKTGCMTNAERRCNLLQQAVPPPGEARSDLSIFIEVADRLGLTDDEGAPLLSFRDARGAFEEWKEISRGTVPDYSGMTYEALAERGGLQWPCTSERPAGTERLYERPDFPTEASATEMFVRDLRTGHPSSAQEYEALDPHGKARLVTAPYEPPPEAPDDEYPLVALTGRQAYHWHTRTKTGKVAELVDAAPGVFVSIHPEDARALGIADGDEVRVSSRRGKVTGPAKLSESTPRGAVFIPFHYGEFDADHAANALTPAMWDPASKQPLHKGACVRVEKLGAQPPRRTT